MTTLPDAVRQSELLNQLVLNRSTMEELGRIEVLWMYPPNHRVLGFVCKTGFLGRKKLAFKLSQVEAMGANGILTHAQPDETDADRVSQLESLVQCEVWSTAGHKLGKIIDCVFNLRTGAITDYLVVGDRLSSLTGSIYRLPPHQVLNLGRDRVLVAATVLADLTPYREGLQQKIAKVSTTLKDEYEDVTEELRSLAKRAQSSTQQTTGQLKTLAEQARERAQQMAEQARERAQEFNEQWLESAQHLAEQARETTESLVERVQDSTQDWTEPLRDRPTGTVPAETVADWDDDLDDWEEEFDEEDFDEDDFDGDQPPQSTPTAAAASPSPHRIVTPPPRTVTPPPSRDMTAEEDFWVIGDDLTLKRRTTIAQDQEPFAIDESWNLEDDPWDITEPPTEATPIRSAVPEETFEDAFNEDEEFIETLESEAEGAPAVPTTPPPPEDDSAIEAVSPPQTASEPQSLMAAVEDADDEPWI